MSATSRPVRVGDPVPDVTLPLHDGRTAKLRELAAGQVVVLYFYPKDGTPLCTAQACAFRDAYEVFARLGALVIGVSSDSVERHQKFAQSQRLPFLLASDADGALRRALGVPRTWGIFPGRVTYVIDRQGIVRHIFEAQWTARQHVEEALRVVQKLVEEESDQTPAAGSDRPA